MTHHVEELYRNRVTAEERRLKDALWKVLARAGYGSRRACEEFIANGRVQVNGKVAVLGQKADPAVDRITVDGRSVGKAEAFKYIALYKPRNVLSAAEDHTDRQTVRDLIPMRDTCTLSAGWISIRKA